MRFNLEHWLLKRRISQSQLAEGVGVSRQIVSTWLSGRKKDGQTVPSFPNSETLEEVCLFLDCTPSDLLIVEKRKTTTGKSYRDFPPRFAA